MRAFTRGHSQIIAILGHAVQCERTNHEKWKLVLLHLEVLGDLGGGPFERGERIGEGLGRIKRRGA
jgi:hypothetical protein